MPNAKADMDKLVNFLTANAGMFDEIHVSLDSHNKTHIAHLGFWELNETQKKAIKEKNGIVGFKLDPQPSSTKDINYANTKIQLYDLAPNGILIPGCDDISPKGIISINRKEMIVEKSLLKTLAVDYIYKLTALHAKNPSKPLPNTWPDHCIIGTMGWKIYEPLANVLDNVKLKDKVYIHEKGTNDLVEMYSIFKAEVPYIKLSRHQEIAQYINRVVPRASQKINIPSVNRNYVTDLNKEFITQLRGPGNINTVYVCGEAKTHCVKTSVEDLVGDDGNNVVMLYNVMSDIISPPVFIDPRKTVFAALQKKGVKFATIETDNTIKINEEYVPTEDNYPN